nr:carotenoid oxygenase family protein [Mycolicibacter senuensis]
MPSPSVTAYAPLYDEFDYVVDDYDGELPADLHGTLYRNGPGKLDAGGQQLGHLFDGDGMLSMFTFADGRLHYRNRYVATKHYRKSLASKELRTARWERCARAGSGPTRCAFRPTSPTPAWSCMPESCWRYGRAARPPRSTRTPWTPSVFTDSAAS